MPLDNSKGFFMHSKYTIIGAGLTGLTLAYLLRQQGIGSNILEAKNRLGGRLFTKMSGNHIPIDLGAAWLWDYNPKLKQLLIDLSIPVFPQEIGESVWYRQNSQIPFQQMSMPPQPQVSYRMKGGSTNLALSLASQLESDQLHLNTIVTSITYENNNYEIQTTKCKFTSEIVICCLPPAVATAKIKFSPQLPEDYKKVAQDTQTWIEDSIKFGCGYRTAFWKTREMPATAFSNAGAITELYDYSNEEQDRFALMGFLHPQLNTYTPEERHEAVNRQLEQLFGKDALAQVSYEELQWNTDPFTNPDPAHSLAPHQNNGHPLLRSTFNNGSLWMAGSETSAHLAGYMEGAVHSAMETFDRLMQKS